MTDDWDAAAGTYDLEPDHGLLDHTVRAAWQNLLHPLVPDDAMTAADIACGTGSLTLLLTEWGIHVTGVDRSKQMLAAATSKTASTLPQPAFIHGDAATPPLPPGTFDVVIARHILFMLPDPGEVLGRWARLLRPGGTMILIEGFWGSRTGLRSEETLALVRQHRANAELLQLSSNSTLWGKDVDDERYLIHSPA